MSVYCHNKNKVEAAGVSNHDFVTKTGVIESFNPQTWKITVSIFDDGSDAYPLGAVEVPIGMAWAGAGWGLYCAPEEGTEVVMTFVDKNLAQPISIAYKFNNDFQPLQGVQSQECWLVHSSGSLLKLTNDGNINLIAHNVLNLGGQTINLNASTAINLNSPIVNVSQNIVISGNLSANDGDITMTDGTFNAVNLNASDDVHASGISLKGHTHGNVTNGSDTTNPPNP